MSSSPAPSDRDESVAASTFPNAAGWLEDALETRRRNLEAEEKLLAEHTRRRDECQATVDQFQESVDKIKAHVAAMEDELARLA